MWRTEIGRRPDLEALEVNAPIGYIGSRIYPVEKKVNSSGKIFYMPTITDITAVSGRKNTEALDRNFAASASLSYACAPIEGRSSIAKVEVGDFGGIEKSDEVGGRTAKRSVMAAVEKKQSTKLFTGDAHTVATGGFFDAINDGSKAIRRVFGRTGLVCSLDVYRHIIGLDEVVKRLSFTGVTLRRREEVMSINPEVLREMMQNIFAVDEILIGDEGIWSDAGKAALVKLPEPIEAGYKLQPEFGRTLTYMLDGGTEYEIEASVNDDYKCNDYDGCSQIDIVEFNPEGKYIFSGLKAADPVTPPASEG